MTVESVVESTIAFCDKNEMHIQQSVEVNERSKSVLKRAEEFLRSIENPGRIAIYCTLGLTVGGVMWYMEISTISF